MPIFSKSQLYIEELEYILGRKAYSVRGATVVAAFIEGQILSLANIFLGAHDVKYSPESNQEFYQSLNILKVNELLSPEEIKKIVDFRKERNKSIHGIFKGMTREEWNVQNHFVVELGRPIVKFLDEKFTNIPSTSAEVE